MNYATNVQITLATAWDTLLICDRQSKKDIGKIVSFSYDVYLFLTSPEAKQTYRMIREICVIGWMVAVALWLTLEEWADRFVARCESEPLLTEREVDQTASEVASAAPASSVVHTPKVVKFPALRSIGQGHEFSPVVALLPAGVDSKPVQRKKRNRKQLICATV